MTFGQINELNGINNNGLDKLIIDVCDKADSLNDILNSVDEEVYNLLNNINSSVSKQFSIAYEEMKKNYNIVNENILSYGTDYAKVKSAYTDRSSSIVRQIESISEEVQKMDNYEEGR